MPIRRLSIIAVTLGWTLAAQAQGRPDTLQMSCQSVAELVRRSGAVILATGPNLYDRFVASQAYCQRDELTEPRWTAAADTKQCFVGFGCRRESGNSNDR